jgi:predicted outer membrane repeat protein
MGFRYVTLLFAVLLLPGPVAAQTTIYVDGDATGDSTGTSWSDAYTSLHDALADPAATGSSAPDTEIWIAEGVYTPTDDADILDTFEDTSFTVTGTQDGLAIYGGFAGTETSRSQRDPDQHVTVLSGDKDENDNNKTPTGITPTAIDIDGANSFHVLLFDGGSAPGMGGDVSANVTGATVLDGVTVTAGDADRSSAPDSLGGGLYCDGAGSGNACSPTIKNVDFIGNSAYSGGAAMVNNGHDGGTSSPTIQGTTFSDNSTGGTPGRGGAIYNVGLEGTSSPTIRESVFSSNDAGRGGGAVYNDGRNGVSSPQITDATFSGNRANDGGAIYSNGDSSGTSNPSIRRAAFFANSSLFDGGALYNAASDGTSSPDIQNAVFTGNGGINGGAIFYVATSGGASSPTITNATFSGNVASQGSGGAIHNSASSGTSSPQITNTILWGNSASDDGDEIFNSNASPLLAYSIVEGSGGSGAAWDATLGTDGGGNLDADPQFADPDGPDGTLGTEDDDLRLEGPGSGGGASPAIDAGDNSALSASVDRAGNPRKQDVSGVSDTGDGTAPIIDIGAYESSGAALPVELAGFEGTAVEDGVRLTWQTASEAGNAGFRVQRRRAQEGSGAWTTIGFVEGAGTTTEARRYRFTDQQPPSEAGAVSYRLEQVDTDGTTHLSGRVTVERGPVRELRLRGPAPNPVRERTRVRYAVPDGREATLRLYDVLGRQVRSIALGEGAGRQARTLDVSGLPSGVYVLRLRAGGESTTRRLTVVR